MRASLDIIFAALADPTRRAILSMLLEDDMAVTDVAEPFAMSLAAISKHLGVLTQAGLISQEKRGRVNWCKLEPDSMREARIWMLGFGQVDGIDLDAFERFLEQEFAPAPEVSRDAEALVDSSEAQNDDHDDDETDDVNDVAHGNVLSTGSALNAPMSRQVPPGSGQIEDEH